MLTSRAAKAAKDRISLLPESMMEEIQQYLSAYQSSLYLFESTIPSTPYSASSIGKLMK